MKPDITNRKLRAGIVGGGQGAFIGVVHRIAVELDGQARVATLSPDGRVFLCADNGGDVYAFRLVRPSHSSRAEIPS